MWGTSWEVALHFTHKLASCTELHILWTLEECGHQVLVTECVEIRIRPVDNKSIGRGCSDTLHDDTVRGQELPLAVTVHSIVHKVRRTFPGLRYFRGIAEVVRLTTVGIGVESFLGTFEASRS